MAQITKSGNLRKGRDGTMFCLPLPQGLHFLWDAGVTKQAGTTSMPFSSTELIPMPQNPVRGHLIPTTLYVPIPALRLFTPLQAVISRALLGVMRSQYRQAVPGL